MHRLSMLSRTAQHHKPISSDIETEVHHVAVFYNVILTFQTNLALFSSNLVTAGGYQILISDYFCADKTAFEVAVNDPCCLWGLGPGSNRPRPNLRFASRKVST